MRSLDLVACHLVGDYILKGCGGHIGPGETSGDVTYRLRAHVKLAGENPVGHFGGRVAADNRRLTPGQDGGRSYRGFTGPRLASLILSFLRTFLAGKSLADLLPGSCALFRSKSAPGYFRDVIVRFLVKTIYPSLLALNEKLFVRDVFDHMPVKGFRPVLSPSTLQVGVGVSALRQQMAMSRPSAFDILRTPNVDSFRIGVANRVNTATGISLKTHKTDKCSLGVS